MHVNLSDIVKFIMDNREGTCVCKDWTPTQIAQEAVDSLKLGGLCIVFDDEDNTKIVGIVLAEPIPDYERLHVTALLIKKDLRKSYKSIVKRFVNVFNTQYPNWTIQAYRRDNLTCFENTVRYVKLLSKLSTT